MFAQVEEMEAEPIIKEVETKPATVPAAQTMLSAADWDDSQQK
ncbi:unnamed protein product [Cylicostephanus goldi]|uniref:Uncharacterized protein n=1 Tax=Cylicostephanus goldi TaxID=71465 RepID=A0A3P7NDK6_CYLGO|nr:unnamed protein product [Cylicostephanus goldi]